MANIPSKKELEKAGTIIRTCAANSIEYEQAFRLISSWANLFAVPLKHFQISIKRRLTKQKKVHNYLIGQRLKRMPSIIAKICRFQDMQITRMQDVGGLRIVVPALPNVEVVHSEIIRNRKKNEVQPYKDYISHPKADGYRGIHQIFRYYDKRHPELLGFRIEVQIRTKLQHCWATTVETLGMINGASYKTGGGDEQSRYFFLLVSGLFAIKEECAVPESIVNISHEQIKKEIIELDRKLKITQKLQSLVVSIKTKKVAESDYYYLLFLKFDHEGRGTINITSFSEEEREMAEGFYRTQEMTHRDNHKVSVLLIRADSFRNIKKIYPNYFFDVKMFLFTLDNLLKN